MFEYIEGKIASKTPTFVVIDVGGVAYRINIPISSYEKIVDLSHCRLLIHFAVKEDSQTLYGFISEKERSLFKSLISVSGIGANTGILILSSLQTNEIINAIITSDVALLKSIKGIGAKTAQRMVIELQDSLKKGNEDLVLSPTLIDKSYEEAISALVMLGFKRADAEKVVRKVLKENPGKQTVEEIIKLSLKNL